MTSDSFDLEQLTIEAAATSIRRGELSSVRLIEMVLARISEVEPHVNALVTVFVDDAMAKATIADEEMARGHYRGALHGIPLVVKDLFDVAKSPTTASSKVRADYFALHDAHVVSSLRDAGAIVVAKAHTHEFAYGGITPQTHNPWNLTRIAGGSSGGSAVAVATGEGLVALGTDTAGSIRIPSSCCGVVGIKPTYGRVSKRGVTPLSTSLDHVGPITRTVRDAAVALQVMAGHDANDALSCASVVPDYLEGIEGGVRGLRLGMPQNYFFDHCDGAVAQGVEDLARRLEGLGATIVPLFVHGAASFADVEFTIAMVEASAYHEQMMKERGSLYLDETRERLEEGQRILATAYVRALEHRVELAASWRRDTEDVDVVVTPTLPVVAPPAGQELVTWGDGYEEIVDTTMTRLNCPHNLTGQPVLSMRTGFVDALPYGASFVGRSFDEATVFRVARSAEQLVGEWSVGPKPSLSSFT